MPPRVPKTTWAFSCHCRQWITTAVNGSLRVVYKTRRKKKFTFRAAGSFIQQHRLAGTWLRRAREREGSRNLLQRWKSVSLSIPAFPFSIVTAMPHTGRSPAGKISLPRPSRAVLIKKRNGSRISPLEKRFLGRERGFLPGILILPTVLIRASVADRRSCAIPPAIYQLREIR